MASAANAFIPMIMDRIHQNQHCAIDKGVENRIVISVSGTEVKETEHGGREHNDRVQNGIFDADHVQIVRHFVVQNVLFIRQNLERSNEQIQSVQRNHRLYCHIEGQCH